MAVPRSAPARRARLRSIVVGVALVLGASCKGCDRCNYTPQSCSPVTPSCDFTPVTTECATDADCAPGETCESGFGFSHCTLLVACEQDAECGVCEKCLPQIGGGSACKPALGCEPTSSASGTASASASTGSMSGGCIQGAPPEIVADGIGGASSLAADDARLYWVGDGEVRSVSKQGGAVDVLAAGAYVDAIARADDQLLFADASGVWTLGDGAPTPALVAMTTGATKAIGVVGAATSGTLVWSTEEPAPPHHVFAAPAPTPGSMITPALVVDVAAPAAPVAVDPSAVFYADGASVHALDAMGDEVLHAGGTDVDALTAAGGAVWFVADGQIFRAAPGAGASAITFAPGAVGRLAVDGEVYWAVDATDGAPMIWKIDPATGSASAVVHADGGADPQPRGLVVDATCVYWIATAEGRILRSAR